MAIRERELVGRKKLTTTGTVADVILAQLQAWGIKNMYGVAGDAILPLLDSLQNQKEINYYGVRHESAAGFMASAEGKATGNMGVAICTSGPGLTNLLNGIADASADYIPALVISGQVETKKIGTEAKQYIDQGKVMEPLAVYSGTILHPEATIDVLQKAIIEAKTKKGVAHISVPKDILSMPCTEELRPPIGVLNNVLQEDLHQLDLAIKTLLSARKPMILIGEGATEAIGEVRNLAQKLGAGIIETLGAKGSIPFEYELFIDGIGEGGSEESKQLMLQADTILIVGATWWPENFVPKEAEVIQIDLSPASIEAHKEVNIGLVGNAKNVLSQLNQKLAETSAVNNQEWVQQIKTAKQQLTEKLDRERTSTEVPIAPQRLIAEIDRQVADDAIMVVDTGDHTLWFNQVFRAKKQKVLYSGKWRTMGFAIPAANAAKIANPQKQVVALVGDGCFTMSMMELSTSIKYNLPIVVIVFNNKTLAMEKNKMLKSGMQPFGTELHNPDFAQLAKAFGAEGIRVEEENQLASALQTALQLQKPVVIDVNVSDIKPSLLVE